MKKMLAVMVVFVLILGVAGSSYALNIGYVDIKKVFNQYEGTKKAKAKLQGALEKEQKNIEAKKDELLKLKEDLEKKASVLDKDKVRAKQEELQSKYEKLQKEAIEIEQKLRAQEEELTSNIVGEIRTIVKKIAEEKKYDLVFEQNMLLYGGEDITYIVLKKMNEQ